MNLIKQDIRDVFFNNIKKLFIKNNNFYILTNDADVFAFQQIKNHNRFIDVGVSEQNLINIASGLAIKGKKVLIYGFCNFLCHRGYEQIKINIGSMNLPIVIVGIGPGFSFPYDGPTHHGIQDIGNILLIPEFEIFNVADNNYASFLSKNLFSLKGPSYIRLEKGICQTNFKPKYFHDGFKYFNSNQSFKTLVITTGHFNNIALKNQRKIDSYNLIDLYKFKTLNRVKLIKILKLHKKILIFDENTFNGGISNLINKIILENNLKFSKIFYLTCQENKQIFKYNQSRTEILKYLKLDCSELNKKLEMLKVY